MTSGHSLVELHHKNGIERLTIYGRLCDSHFWPQDPYLLLTNELLPPNRRGIKSEGTTQSSEQVIFIPCLLS